MAMAGAQGSGEEAGLPMWGVVALSLGVIVLGVSLLDDPTASKLRFDPSMRLEYRAIQVLEGIV
ncbi:MAG: hypothetical protein HZY74_10990 [Brevundimonas sp.]|nr:MAG: hypothetical protein HZY74_10990 [Brevundimonas sp.]